LEALGIKLTERTLKKYVPSKLVRLEFEEGWFCYVSDNGVKSAKTILTLHGAPGNHVEWAGLEQEMGGYCRWINFIVPGFDGEDERRGTYNSSRPQLYALILLVLDRLKVGKAVICAHSFSSTYSPSLIKAYPHRFEGYINAAGMGDCWNHGFLSVYHNVTVSQGYYLMA
jgi:pimeloyl-ACP methyl ester carboxylesterase